MGWPNHPQAQTEWPATPYGMVRPPQHISSSFFFFLVFGFYFLNKICDWGILEKKKKRGQNGRIATI
jgi:hypothetical protein